MQRIAIIDIGSNSARLVISHIYKNGAYNMVYNQKESLRLAHKVDGSGLLTEEAFSSMLETMRNFAYMCTLYKVDKTIGVATAAIRNANNGAELIDYIAKETGIKLHIISGNTEAYISYLGVINTLSVKDGIIFDLGGGSTELILFKDRNIVNSVSLPFGAVNTTDIFHTKNEMKGNVYSDLRFFLASLLANYPWLKQENLPLIGVGGTARTVAKIIQREKNYPATKLHNYAFSVRVFRSFFTKLRNTNFEQRKKISGLSTERNDIILAGCAIISCLLDATNAPEIITSGCGLREGLFYDYYYKLHNEPVVAEDILQKSRENVLGLNSVNKNHARKVNELVLKIFDSWSELHKAGPEYKPLLETAALLHDIGISINFYSHARHSAYMILNAKLFGLTHREQTICAAIAGWHNGASKNYFRSKFYKDMVDEAGWEIITKLACMLAIAESLDYTETNQVKTLIPIYEKRTAKLIIEANGPLNVELQQLRTHLKWFKKTFNVPLVLEIDQQLIS